MLAYFSTVLRARIRQGALRAQQQRQAELADLAQWLAAHERFRYRSGDRRLASVLPQLTRINNS